MGERLQILLSLFSTFFRVGLFTFGGGFAMIPVIKKELVDNRQWLDEEHFVDSISITQTVPGAVAVNLAVFSGYAMLGTVGAFVSMVGVVLPSFLVILSIAIGLQNFADSKTVQEFFMGVRPAVVALIIYAAWQIAAKTKWSVALGFVGIAITGLVLVFDVSPIIAIIGGGIAGVVSFFWKHRRQGQFEKSQAKSSTH